MFVVAGGLLISGSGKHDYVSVSSKEEAIFPAIVGMQRGDKGRCRCRKLVWKLRGAWGGRRARGGLHAQSEAEQGPGFDPWQSPKESN